MSIRGDSTQESLFEDNRGLTTTEYILILLGIVALAASAWSLFTDSTTESTEEAGIAIRDMEGRAANVGLSVLGQAQGVGGHLPNGQAPQEIGTLPSGAPPASSSSSSDSAAISSSGSSGSSFLDHINSYKNENQGEGRTVIPNAIFGNNDSASTSSPTYIADSSGGRVNIPANQEGLDFLLNNNVY